MSTNNSRGTHPLNVSYLVVGLVFLGLSGSWALRQAGIIDLGEVRWLFPLTLVVAGLVGVVAMAAKGFSRSKPGQSQEPGYDTGHETMTPFDGGEER